MPSVSGATRRRRAGTFFLRHGHKAVFFARFVPWIRVSAGPLSGVSRMPYGRYFIYNFLAALTYVSVMTVLGYLFAPQLDQLLELFRRGRWVGASRGGRRAAATVAVLVLEALGERSALAVDPRPPIWSLSVSEQQASPEGEP